MFTYLITDITSKECKKSLSGFWNHVCEISQKKDFLIIALPLLMADGWQTEVQISHCLPGYATLRDGGQLSSWLAVRGVNINSGYTHALFQEGMNKFGIKEDEKGFYKHLPMPLDAKEIQLFGAFLSSMSHLIYRVQETSRVEYESYSAVINTVRSLHLEPLEHISYKTPYREITVDLTVKGKHRASLFQTFDQHNRAGDIMEIWSYRMKEIANTGKYKTGLIYNENVFRPDESVLKVARGNCDLVCPSHRIDEIRDFTYLSIA
ncbi:MAG: hypothetical protein RR373_01380 [Akkermansia sp.]